MTSSQPTEGDVAYRVACKFAAAQNEREREAQRGGAEAVARWAAPGCTAEQQAELAAYYERLQQQAGGMTAA